MIRLHRKPWSFLIEAFKSVQHHDFLHRIEARPLNVNIYLNKIV